MENMDKGLTVPKMGADSLAENKYPKCPRIYLPNLSAQAQKILDFNEKKGFIWVSVVSGCMYAFDILQIISKKSLLFSQRSLPVIPIGLLNIHTTT